MGTCSVHLDALYISLYTGVYSDTSEFFAWIGSFLMMVAI